MAAEIRILLLSGLCLLAALPPQPASAADGFGHRQHHGYGEYGGHHGHYGHYGHGRHRGLFTLDPAIGSVRRETLSAPLEQEAFSDDAWSPSWSDWPLPVLPSRRAPARLAPKAKVVDLWKGNGTDCRIEQGVCVIRP